MGELASVTNTLAQMQEENNSIHFFLAEHNGEAIGMALYYFAYSSWVGKSIHLDDLYVQEQYRGNGIGTKLLYALFEVAQEEGCSRLRWEVEEQNLPAQQFYTGLGAKLSDKWFNCSFDRDDIETFLTKYSNSGVVL